MSSLNNEEKRPTDDDLMKQYQMMVDLYKFHFEIVLKFIIFYLAVTGAILSFYLSQPNIGFMRFALALPIFMGFVFCVFALVAANQVDPMKVRIVQVTGDLSLKPYPNEGLLNRLKHMLILTGCLSFIIAVCLCIVSAVHEEQPNNRLQPTRDSVPIMQSPSQ